MQPPDLDPADEPGGARGSALAHPEARVNARTEARAIDLIMSIVLSAKSLRHEYAAASTLDSAILRETP
jgi:hypothetical protein